MCVYVCLCVGTYTHAQIRNTKANVCHIESRIIKGENFRVENLFSLLQLDTHFQNFLLMFNLLFEWIT